MDRVERRRVQSADVVIGARSQPLRRGAWWGHTHPLVALFSLLAGLWASSCSSPTEGVGPVAALELVREAAGGESGTPFATQPILHFVDAQGRRVRAGGVREVRVSVSAEATVIGNPRIGAIEGSADFWDLGLEGPAGVTLILTYSADGVAGVIQEVTLSAGAAAEIAVLTAGAGAVNGGPLTTQPVIEVRDAQGNRRLQDDATVVTASVSAGGTVTGSLSAVAVDGRATFETLGINGLVGSYTLSFAAPTLDDVSHEISVAIGPPASLVIERPAQDVVSGSPFTVQPRIRFLDAGGNPLQGTEGPVVTMGVDGGASVTGTISATASAGRATFTDVGISGTPGQSFTLTFSSPGLAPVTQLAHLGSGVWDVIASGPSSACGITGSITRCWEGTVVGPPAVLGGAPAFVSVELGDWRKCGRTATGEAWCWAVPTPIPGGVQLSLEPSLVPGGHTFEQVVTTMYSACGLTGAGAAYCWGDNAHGVLGDGTTIASETPVAVVGGHVFESLAAGAGHVCGLKADGAAWCWGVNAGGHLGDGTTTTPTAPVAVTGGHQFSSIDPGSSLTCGITTAGQTLCWGLTAYLGSGGGADFITPTPTPVSGGHAFVSVSTGQWATCGLTAAGAAWCWGANPSGELGTGNLDHTLVPVPSLPGRSFSSISMGAHAGCGRLTTGAAICWGYGYSRQDPDPPGLQPRDPVAIVRP